MSKKFNVSNKVKFMMNIHERYFLTLGILNFSPLLIKTCGNLVFFIPLIWISCNGVKVSKYKMLSYFRVPFRKKLVFNVVILKMFPISFTGISC